MKTTIPLSAVTAIAILSTHLLAAAVPPPRLEIEAPPSLEGDARRASQISAARLELLTSIIGLEEPGPPIVVVLAPETTPLAHSTPPWISGFAVPDQNVVVLFPARAHSYPDDGFEELLLHEITHVLVYRAAGGRDLPRWFQEGVATTTGRSWQLEDRTRFAIETLATGDVSLATISSMFERPPPQITRAYAFAGAFVHDLFVTRGAESIRKILSGVREGEDFPVAFRQATSMTLADAEADFWKRHRRTRWILMLTSSMVLWIVITLLALVAMTVARIRRARQPDLELVEMPRESGPPEEPEDDEPVN
ncbi:MAG: hypothetical protein WBX15_11575 [Thermoanaerobaculia bacterium]